MRLKTVLQVLKKKEYFGKLNKYVKPYKEYVKSSGKIYLMKDCQKKKKYLKGC